MAWAASPSSTTPPGPEQKPYARGSGRSSRTSCGTRSSGRVAASSSPTGACQPANQRRSSASWVAGGLRAGPRRPRWPPSRRRPGRRRARRAGWRRTGSRRPGSRRRRACSVEQPGRAVAGDDRLPGGEPGADRDRLRGQRAPDRAVDAVRGDQQVGLALGAAVADRGPPARADPHGGHVDAGADLDPVAEAGHQRVVEVLEVHDGGGRAGAGPRPRRDQPLAVRAAHPAVGQRRGDAGPAAVRVRATPGPAGRWPRAPARSGGAATRSPRSSSGDLPAGAGERTGGGQPGHARAHHDGRAHVTRLSQWPRISVRRRSSRTTPAGARRPWPAAGSSAAATGGSMPVRSYSRKRSSLTT